jgi:predicted transcriptional regulator
MRVLWKRAPATVADVIEDMEGARKPAHNTVLTLLTILERKGYVAHVKEGRAFAYRPLIGSDQARRTALSYLLNRFFDDSPELLVLNLIEQNQIEPDELGRVRDLLDRKPAVGDRETGRRRGSR